MNRLEVMMRIRRIFAGATLVGAALSLLSAARPAGNRAPGKTGTAASPGALLSVDKDGNLGVPCPLKHTDVKASISGFLARVNVTQEFENPSDTNIEAVYTFPLPDRAAVDSMTMLVGDRTVRGVIKRREEAQRIFDDARRTGRTASLLDQERPNVFTQSVTNIGPGMKVRIQISYVETLKYEAGTYEFGFPMVVGPRYMPAGMRGTPDAARIDPPVAPKGVRAGHDVSLAVELDAGVPVQSITADTHAVDIERRGSHEARVRLRNEREIPNRDFVLRYAVAGDKVRDAVLTHRGGQGGFFSLILQPPARVAESEVTPRELVFVVDTSGSMMGHPLDKCKELIKLSLDGLHPRDTFNLITFSGDTHILFPKPVPATPQNVAAAQRFMLSRNGQGGTEMMRAIRAALDPSDEQDHMRVVVFLTDGYVGNDMEIIGEVKRHPNARVFSFGIGSSVNRFLLDRMASEGRGEVEYAGLNGDASDAVKRLYERVRTPLLTNVEIDWNGLPVTDVYPARIPDLFSAKPVVVHGRYDGPARGEVRLRGQVAGRPFTRTIAVDLPAEQASHDVLGTLWARSRVEGLMAKDWSGMQHGEPRGDIKEQIIEIGIKFKLMTQFTSFVAVAEIVVDKGGKPVRTEVPVEMPHGVSHEGVFGEARRAMVVNSAPGVRMFDAAGLMAPRQQRASMSMPPPPAMTVVPMETARLKEEAKAEPQKLDTDLLALARQGSTAVVEIKVWLNDDSAAVITEIRKLGLDITSRRPGKLVVGKIRADKLETLAKSAAVLYVLRDLGQP